jgi:hypothetical protein
VDKAFCGTHIGNTQEFRTTACCAPSRSITTQKTVTELCPQEVCLRPFLPWGSASRDYFLKLPRGGRSVVLSMRLHRPDQWFFLSPEKLYFSSCNSVLLGVRCITWNSTIRQRISPSYSQDQSPASLSNCLTTSLTLSVPN